MEKLHSFRKCLRQTGFSIVELMVAILIGLIILAGVIQVVATSKTSFVGQEEMSFIQENARYAMDVIGKDVQGAGYWGCAGSGANVALVAGVDNVAAQPFLGMLSVEGFLNETDAPDAYADKLRTLAGGAKSESLLLRSFSGPAVPVESHVGTTLTLLDNHNMADGNYVGIVAEDCQRIGIFRAATAENDTITYAASQNNSINSIKPELGKSIICPGADCSTTYSQNYNPGAVVMNFTSHAYFIGESTALPGLPALKRAVLRNGAVAEEEIALGVEDMHLRFGVRENNNLRYWSANAVPNWNNVVAVEVTLLMRSQSPSLPGNETLAFAEGTRTYNNRFMKQMVSSTFRIRNRI